MSTTGESLRGGTETLAAKIAIPLMLAFITATAAYATSYVDRRRQEDLALVSAQIEKLYGPLYSYVLTTDTVFVRYRFLPQSQQDAYFNGRRSRIREIEMSRRWMRNVFQPINVKMEDAIVNNAQLLVDARMPPMFLSFVAHTESWKAVIAKWSVTRPVTAADTLPVDNSAAMPYPPEPAFTNCIVGQFRVLNALKLKLETEDAVTYLFTHPRARIPAACGV